MRHVKNSPFVDSNPQLVFFIFVVFFNFHFVGSIPKFPPLAHPQSWWSWRCRRRTWSPLPQQTAPGRTTRVFRPRVLFGVLLKEMDYSKWKEIWHWKINQNNLFMDTIGRFSSTRLDWPGKLGHYQSLEYHHLISMWISLLRHNLGIDQKPPFFGGWTSIHQLSLGFDSSTCQVSANPPARLPFFYFQLCFISSAQQ